MSYPGYPPNNQVSYYFFFYCIFIVSENDAMNILSPFHSLICKSILISNVR